MKFDQLLIDYGMAPSKAEARRLLKQNAVSYRFQDTDWMPLIDVEIIVEPYPYFYLKVGSGNWRCVKMGAKFEQFPGVVKVKGTYEGTIEHQVA